MNKDVNDFDIIKFLEGFRFKETKEQVTKLYVEGKISRDEYFRRMKGAR